MLKCIIDVTILLIIPLQTGGCMKKSTIKYQKHTFQSLKLLYLRPQI